jgi:hypothetical protein
LGKEKHQPVSGPKYTPTAHSWIVEWLLIDAKQLFNRFVFSGHELSAQEDGFGERGVASGETQELFFEDSARKLAFHVCLSLSVLPGQSEPAPSWPLQEA